MSTQSQGAVNEAVEFLERQLRAQFGLTVTIVTAGGRFTGSVDTTSHDTVFLRNVTFTGPEGGGAITRPNAQIQLFQIIGVLTP